MDRGADHPLHHRADLKPARRLLAAASLSLLLTGCASGRQGAPPRTTEAPPTTGLPTTSTSTTVDPGTLPQTPQLPSASDPAFQARIAALWSAITAGQPSLAVQAFFPLSAYIQVKGISDPVHDYQTRLIANFDQDIMSLHSQIAGPATFESVTVPDTARWILPGVEYNKGSYWRVLGARVNFQENGQTRYFTIASMISWRGQWYVVHLLSIR